MGGMRLVIRNLVKRAGKDAPGRWVVFGRAANEMVRSPETPTASPIPTATEQQYDQDDDQDQFHESLLQQRSGSTRLDEAIAE